MEFEIQNCKYNTNKRPHHWKKMRWIPHPKNHGHMLMVAPCGDKFYIICKKDGSTYYKSGPEEVTNFGPPYDCKILRKWSEAWDEVKKFIEEPASKLNFDWSKEEKTWNDVMEPFRETIDVREFLMEQS